MERSVTEHFFPVGVGGGGAMYAPAISPHDANLLFVSCDMGGVYRTDDGGETWMMIDKRQLRDTDACPVAFHPRNGDVIYAAARGAFKISVDRGVTWSALCADAPWGEARCSAIEIDEENVELMFVGSGSGAHRS